MRTEAKAITGSIVCPRDAFVMAPKRKKDDSDSDDSFVVDDSEEDDEVMGQAILSLMSKQCALDPDDLASASVIALDPGRRSALPT